MKNILIIENSISIKNILKKYLLKHNDVHVYEVNSLAQAKELILTNDFFIVITNLVLSDSTNLEILDLLKNENLPTVVFSSDLKDESIRDKYSNIINYVLKDVNGFEYIDRLISAMTFSDDEEVLLVEDSLTQAKFIKDILERLLLKVTIARNGVEALEILNENKNYSLILCDYEMPVMHGLELIKKVRLHKHYNKIPILFITKIYDMYLKIDLYKYGANDILLKPILKEELISKVIDIFLNKKYIKEIESFNMLFDKYIISSTTDTEGYILSVSDAFCKISGYEREELLGKNHNIVRHPDMPSSFYENMWNTITHGEIWEGEIKNLRKNKSYYWVKATIEPIFSKHGKIIGYSAIRQDITDKKKLEKLSITDELTNVYNRRYFNEIFPKILNSVKRKNELICFMFIDIDNFKLYNDNYGHDKGDLVLVNFAKSLKESLHRFNDYVFRLGGEEFVVIYTANDKDKAIEFANIVLTNIRNLKMEHKYSDVENYVTASIGLVCDFAENIDYEEVYQKADNLLYEAKRNGKNQIKLEDKIN